MWRACVEAVVEVDQEVTQIYSISKSRLDEVEVERMIEVNITNEWFLEIPAVWKWV